MSAVVVGLMGSRGMCDSRFCRPPGSTLRIVQCPCERRITDTVGISVAVFVIAKLGFELDLLQSFLMVLAALIVLAPINLRLARILWINMFVNFKEETEIEKLKE